MARLLYPALVTSVRARRKGVRDPGRERGEHLAQRLFTPRGPRFASSDMVLRAAVQGQGVALARHRLAVDDVAAGALVRPLEGLNVELGAAYWLVLPTHGRARPATAAA